jgi:hypothetical protein
LQLEAEIDLLVYALNGLIEEEIALWKGNHQLHDVSRRKLVLLLLTGLKL